MPKKYTGKSPQQQKAEIESALKTLPTRIANLGVNHFKANFDNQGWEGEKWVKRKDKDGHPLLEKTRTLYRSIKKEVNANNVRVFVAAPADKYATVHNEGFKGVVSVKRRGGNGRRSARTEGATFTRNMNIPQRKFIGKSDKLDKKANQLVEDTINKLLKP